MRTTTKIATAATFLFAACSVSPPATPTGEVATQAPPVTAQPEIAPSATPEQPSASPTTTSPAAMLTPLDLASDLEAIRLRMLHSHENWRSI
jgi:hypothetical protein